MNKEKFVFNRPAFFILFKKSSFFISLLSFVALSIGYFQFETVGQWKFLQNWIFDFLPSTIVTYTFLVFVLSAALFSLSLVGIYFYVAKFLSFGVDANGVFGPVEEKLFPRKKYILLQDIRYMGLDVLGSFVVQAVNDKLRVPYKLNRFDEFYLRKSIKDAINTR
ncbi:hypothetical protein M899_1143 [Bacteriovorax sp. BSW11_IV]|uniref:hypothetical protein n=1 Tax=Bacteriovorax sp. BSW11_IV TaxID=1353529 RepID=UPI00038A556E|nr:hypothetical protein [Bacteriovorax sp. BSW11_IV]EQC46750.1 hypothetical protein M899_1143 [Bacteriovorax sp. BSW11_IV]